MYQFFDQHSLLHSIYMYIYNELYMFDIKTNGLNVQINVLSFRDTTFNIKVERMILELSWKP